MQRPAMVQATRMTRARRWGAAADARWRRRDGEAAPRSISATSFNRRGGRGGATVYVIDGKPILVPEAAAYAYRAGRKRLRHSFFLGYKLEKMTDRDKVARNSTLRHPSGGRKRRRASERRAGRPRIRYWLREKHPLATTHAIAPAAKIRTPILCGAPPFAVEVDAPPSRALRRQLADYARYQHAMAALVGVGAAHVADLLTWCDYEESLQAAAAHFVDGESPAARERRLIAHDLLATMWSSERGFKCDDVTARMMSAYRASARKLWRCAADKPAGGGDDDDQERKRSDLTRELLEKSASIYGTATAAGMNPAARMEAAQTHADCASALVAKLPPIPAPGAAGERGGAPMGGWETALRSDHGHAAVSSATAQKQRDRYLAPLDAKDGLRARAVRRTWTPARTGAQRSPGKTDRVDADAGAPTGADGAGVPPAFRALSDDDYDALVRTEQEDAARERRAAAPLLNPSSGACAALRWRTCNCRRPCSARARAPRRSTRRPWTRPLNPKRASCSSAVGGRARPW